MPRIYMVLVLAVLGIGCAAEIAGAKNTTGAHTRRQKAARLQDEGNHKEAYGLFAGLALDPQDDPERVGKDLAQAITCLHQLHRVNEVDEFRERVIAIHEDNWHLLLAAADTMMSGPHHGHLIAGEFERGPHRGGGRAVNSFERDRARALQLLQRAMVVTPQEAPGNKVADLYRTIARVLLGNRGYYEAWRLQDLTDLNALPDYGQRRYDLRFHGGPEGGAPVGAAGTPVYHLVPDGWDAAATDGERWRWALKKLGDHDAREGEWTLANFVFNQFGVQTMRQYPWFFGRSAHDREDQSGAYALHTLNEDETIARLSVGIRRFKLPGEFNYIRIYQHLANDPKGSHAAEALGQLALIFQNRRQYAKAADTLRRSIAEHDDRHQKKQKQLGQIIGNWGQFEPVVTQPAGQGATVDFRFRNGIKVHLKAHRVRVGRLLDDVKTYLKSSPRRLDRNQLQISRIGYRLVQQNQSQYIGERVAAWDLDLEPPAGHFDQRVTISTPLQKAGAYLLTAQMGDGNVSRIIVWVADTAIVTKPLSKQRYYFVADAATGAPIGRAKVELFGYRQERTGVKGDRDRFVVHTPQVAALTDVDGQCLLQARNGDERYQWLAIATTPGGRLAYHGFSGAWHDNYRDGSYNASKTFVITDRPVYRPKHTVRFKFWINQAKYGQEGKSVFAGQQFEVWGRDPKGEKVFEETFAADAFGGFDGEYELPADAPLGVYQLYLPHGPGGGGNFRVEQYKKPEFAVTIESQERPIGLGEKITARVKARYYFGAPVTQAKVKYKVLRYDHGANWYPHDAWDWLYTPGYWWFGQDYPWYPGWAKWGCARPAPWWGWRPQPHPEVVAEAQMPIGPDGSIPIEIDTAVAKAIHGDKDHRYEITVEVTDRSRRTIVSRGKVLVARRPFKVYVWVDRGHYRVGDAISARFNVQTLDHRPVRGAGRLTLYRVTYTDAGTVETPVERWDLDPDDQGRAQIEIKAARPGQYRLSYEVTDADGRTIEGGYVLTVRGQGFDGRTFRFNEIELIADKRTYQAGETVELLVNTNRTGGTVVLFTRPVGGVYLPPKVMRIDGKSEVENVTVTKRDMPNFFVEAFTISGGKVYSDTRQIVVPPENRVLKVEVGTSAAKYKPGERAIVNVRLTDSTGEPFQGSAVLSIYDKAVEYISGGSNVPAIKEFFWKWRRRHRSSFQTNLNQSGRNLLRHGEIGMGFIGVFGQSVVDEVAGAQISGQGPPAPGLRRSRVRGQALNRFASDVAESMKTATPLDAGHAGFNQTPLVQPAIRQNFADTALWVAALTTNQNGKAEVQLTMPENLTTWKAKVWALGHGTRVGEGEAEAVTTKNLIVRLQAPRFFVEKDEVVLSANVHNYLEVKKAVRVELELEGGALELIDRGSRGSAVQTVEVDANGEARVNWRVRAIRSGEIVIRMKALTDVESDAVQMDFPVFVHGILKTESYSGLIRPNQQEAGFRIVVPSDRHPRQSRLEIRYSPSLAGAMVDALPYMVAYPYGCTEQTLNRFLPAVIVKNVLLGMGLDLEQIREKRAKLNDHATGEDVGRAKLWKRHGRNPVFDTQEVAAMVDAGFERLAAMQLSDGGWGWFSGWGERSYPHTTAVVVHGLQIARNNNIAISPDLLRRGVDWLQRYQDQQVTRLKNAADGDPLRKGHADNLDAFVYMVLVDEKIDDPDMRDFLYRDRNHLAVYTKAQFALALHRLNLIKKRDMLIRNVEQFLVQDDENQTAWLNLPGNDWWHWHGSEYEAHAYYLKLLTATDPNNPVALRLVKYLINNRKHATYWNSTRDTALVIEAFADYLKATGEDDPDMTVRIAIDGKQVKQVRISKENLFTFDNRFALVGEAVTAGTHEVMVSRQGKGPVYLNAYLTNFTLEDPIARAGLEIKVRRRFYKLVSADKKIKTRGDRGQPVGQRVRDYDRIELVNLDSLTSGDLVEVELEIESKNDYEYILFEDMKAAGFEPVDVRSGYHANGLGAYMELRDERVSFFVARLARGRHSIAYRMRAEVPGQFSVLPTRASAMYAPELKANSDEIKLVIND